MWGSQAGDLTDLRTCCLIKVYRHFRKICSFHFDGRRWSWESKQSGVTSQKVVLFNTSLSLYCHS
jgi:hypothetical protein